MTWTTCIRDADWVVAWDGATGRHQYLKGADVAFTGDAIVFVGADYGGTVDEEVSGAGLMVMPGLVDIHRGNRRICASCPKATRALHDNALTWAISR